MRWQSTYTWSDRRTWNPVAIAAAVVGVLLLTLVVVKGEDFFAHLKGKRLLREIKAVENAIWEYKDRKRFWPGDCDHNGVINYTLEHSVQAAALLSPAVVPMNESCQSEFAEEDQNSAFSDLRMARLWVYGAPNNIAALHTDGGVFQVGSDGGKNIIVVYDLSARLAKMIDVQLDGTESGDQGRIRRWDEKAGGSPWPDNDVRVSMVFYFDQTL